MKKFFLFSVVLCLFFNACRKICLPPNTFLSGSVVDEKTNLKVEGVDVRLFSYFPNGWFSDVTLLDSTVTDANGKYNFHFNSQSIGPNSFVLLNINKGPIKSRHYHGTDTAFSLDTTLQKPTVVPDIAIQQISGLTVFTKHNQTPIKANDYININAKYLDFFNSSLYFPENWKAGNDSMNVVIFAPDVKISFKIDIYKNGQLSNTKYDTILAAWKQRNELTIEY